MRLSLGLAIVLIAAPAVAGQIYRYVGDDGHVHYSDLPPAAGTDYVVIETETPSRPPASAAAPARQPEPAAAPAPASKEVVEAATAAQNAEDRAANCATAREREASYSVSHRLYRELPNGEREYLDDAETDAARAEAHALVEQWCD